jgi:pyrroline-5-carboxylate reductase
MNSARDEAGADRPPVLPVLILGGGRMGQALLSGWARSGGGIGLDGVMVRDPAPSEGLTAFQDAGVRLNPSLDAVGDAQTLILAVKPQVWRSAAAAAAPLLRRGAVVVSIAAGVRCADLAAAFERPVARVMPTTAIAVCKGAAAIFAAPDDDLAARAAHALFDPLARTVDVANEDLMDAATAVSGSAPAYFYLFMEALEAAATAAGLSAEQASILVRQTLIGAAALLEAGGQEPAELRRQVTSKNGTTEAALKVLQRDVGLSALIAEAVAAATARARELAN